MKRLRVPAPVPARSVWPVAVWVAVGIVVTAFLAGSALAQEADGQPFDLVGQVTDESGKPLVGAFVSQAESDWGSLTAETGRFVLPNVTPGVVTLRAELIGYETLTWTGTVADGRAVSLTLVAQPIVLEGLSVVTDRFETRRRGVATPVRWYDHDDLATSPQPTAMDFVASRTGLYPVRCNGRVSDRCIWVRGRLAEPSVYVDEVPIFGGVEYLETIQPHELYMVEVYGGGRHIRAYTTRFMQQAAEHRIRPIPILW